MVQVPEKKRKKEQRLGLRVDTKVFDRLADAMPKLKREARERGEKTTQQAVVEEAIARYLDFVQSKGNEIMRDVEEVIALGSDRTQRVLFNCIEECKQKAQAEAARRTPKTAG